MNDRSMRTARITMSNKLPKEKMNVSLMHYVIIPHIFTLHFIIPEKSINLHTSPLNILRRIIVQNATREAIFTAQNPNYRLETILDFFDHLDDDKIQNSCHLVQCHIYIVNGFIFEKIQ